MSSETVFGILLALFAAIAWGVSSLLYRIGLRTHNYLSSSLIRAATAFPFLVMITISLSNPATFGKLTLELWFILVCSAIVLCIGDLLYMAALGFTPISRAVPISSSYPIFATIFAVLLLNEKPNALTILGTIGVVGGISLVVRYGRASNNRYKSPDKSTTGGELLVLVAAVAWGLAIVLVGIILNEPGVEVIPIVCARLLILLAVYIFLTLLRERSNLSIPRKVDILDRGSLALGLGGIFGWVFGMTAMFISLDLIGASRAVPLSSVYPLIAVTLGVIFLQEKVCFEQLMGIVLIIFGCILVIL